MTKVSECKMWPCDKSDLMLRNHSGSQKKRWKRTIHYRHSHHNMIEVYEGILLEAKRFYSNPKRLLHKGRKP